MPVKHRPPMPRLPPFALADIEPPRKRPYYLILFFLLFTGPLFVVHLQLLSLPYFWDEHGQFIPTALDLLRHGWWVARSTIPNVHPPGVEVYLVLWYKLFGYSITVTRAAMLVVTGVGLLVTFLLAIELSQGTTGAPAFWPPLLLFASPLFYMQSFMAQLDMPAMVFTLLALLLFLKRRFAAAAAVSVVLVLMKETGLVTPLVFFLILVFRRNWRACYFVAPALALGAWLLVLHGDTGYWLGNPGFAHYNVGYSLHPVRMALSFARRLYYLFFAEFRWIGTLVLFLTARKVEAFRSTGWKIACAVCAANIVLVSVLGGAELERYLLPVLPVFYIAVAVGLTAVHRAVGLLVSFGLAIGLAANLFWNPPYPFPYENNYSMVDFVRLQQTAAQFADRNLRDKTIATAWPLTAAVERPEYGYADHPLKAVETNDFHVSSIKALPPASFDALITYTRTWAPQNGWIAFPLVRRFLSHFYEWEPDITTEQCFRLGLTPEISWSSRGQTITIYTRK